MGFWHTLASLIRDILRSAETKSSEVDPSITAINPLMLLNFGMVQANNIRRISKIYSFDLKKYDFLLCDVIVRKSGRRIKMVRKSCVFFVPSDCFVFTLRTKWSDDCSLFLLEDEYTRTFAERIDFWNGVGVEQGVKERLALFIPGAFANT